MGIREETARGAAQKQGATEYYAWHRGALTPCASFSVVLSYRRPGQQRSSQSAEACDFVPERAELI